MSYYQKNREAILKARKKYYYENRERILESNKKHNERYKKMQREQHKVFQKATFAIRRFPDGINPFEMNEKTRNIQNLTNK